MTLDINLILLVSCTFRTVCIVDCITF